MANPDNIGSINEQTPIMPNQGGSASSNLDTQGVFDLAHGLAGTGQADLEAYIRQLFGENGGTIGQEVAAGRMTADQAVAMLIQAGFSPQEAQYMVATGQLNVPLLTLPGDIASRMGPRGGIRALSGPYAIERSLAAQEVVRRAQAIQSEALRAAMQYSAATHEPPAPPERPPLPPVPLTPSPAAPKPPPWYQQAIDPISKALGAIGTAYVNSLFQNKGERSPNRMAYGDPEHYPQGYKPEGGVPRPPQPPYPPYPQPYNTPPPGNPSQNEDPYSGSNFSNQYDPYQAEDPYVYPPEQGGEIYTPPPPEDDQSFYDDQALL